jgi:putative ubiquitin-RnfH superfamily antitoxin RatB of RatAB toxin-antitoxin module
MLALEVVYALPGRQTLLPVRVPRGATVEDALAASGIFGLHPETSGDAFRSGYLAGSSPATTWSSMATG